ESISRHETVARFFNFHLSVLCGFATLRDSPTATSRESLVSPMAENAASIPLDIDYPELRDAVVRVCRNFPGKYWRELDAKSDYPTEFVNAMTEQGYLAALIPEEYGGAGLPVRAGSVILETIHQSGCSAGACHAQMYTMGMLVRHGSAEQK